MTIYMQLLLAKHRYIVRPFTANCQNEMTRVTRILLTEKPYGFCHFNDLASFAGEGDGEEAYKQN